MATRRPPEAVVVGGGIAGLTAARDLAAAGLSVLVLEGSPDVGGKLRLGQVGGARSTSAPSRCSPAGPRPSAWPPSSASTSCTRRPGSTQLWTRGALRPLPRTLLGVPARPGRGRGVRRDLRRRRRARPARDRASRSRTTTSRSPTCRRPAGRTRSSTGWSEPLLGGVYAGHATHLSAAAPPSRRSCRCCASTARSSAAAAALPPPSDLAVFAGLVGGIGRLPARWSRTAASRCAPRPGACAASRTAAGFRLTVGSTRAPETDRDRARRRWRHPAADRAAARRPRARRRARARRRRVRLDGHRHPGRSGARGRRLVGVPGARRRRPADQGRDVLLQQVGLGRRGHRRPDPAGLARPAPRGGHPAGHGRRAGGRTWSPTSRPRSGQRDPSGRRARAALGRRAAAVRRRPPRPGRPHPRRASTPYPGSPSAARRTTASGSRP